MKRISGALLTISLAGCTLFPGTPSVPGVSGRVDFGDGYKAQATMADIAIAATVSLIDANTNNTVSSTITDSGGSFNMYFQGWSPTDGNVYYFEAVKGLGNNKAGNSAARVRTMARFSGGNWEGIAIGQSIWLSQTTTALSVIASLRGPATVAPTSLIQRLLRNTPDTSIEPHTNETFSASGTGISNADFHQVFGLVRDVLTQNADPLARIVYEDSTYKMIETPGGGGNPGPEPSPTPTPTPTPPPLSGTPPTFTGLTPAEGVIGMEVLIYGTDFAATNSDNTVSFNGTKTKPISSSPTFLRVKVPSGATTGDVLVVTPSGTSSAKVFTVKPAGQYDFGGSIGM